MNIPENHDPGYDPAQYLIKHMLDDIERTEKKTKLLEAKKKPLLGYYDWWMIFVGIALLTCLFFLVYYWVL
jgi:hypothetical protein